MVVKVRDDGESLAAECLAHHQHIVGPDVCVGREGEVGLEDVAHAQHGPPAVHRVPHRVPVRTHYHLPARSCKPGSELLKTNKQKISQ